MGETGCGKTSLLSYLALKLKKVKFLIFNIHAGITRSVFLKEIKHYFSVAILYPTENVWIFFDEFNTSESMYLITELICKNTLLGQPIPANIKLFAACNPYKLKPKKLKNVGLENKHNLQKTLYLVNPLPESIIEYIWDFGTVKNDDERNYIKNMLIPLDLKKHELACGLVNASHEFLRMHQIVSLRDVERFRLFYQWFKKNIKIRNEIMKCLTNTENLENGCLVLSIFICYFIRLSTEELRVDFIKKLNQVFKNNGVQMNQEDFEKIYKDEQDEYLNRMNLTPGIARNNALRENVFASLVCILNGIPILVCGKPGCSKSLCIQLIISSLKGEESSNSWFKSLPRIFSVVYQGSKSSTAEGIIKVFETAKKIAISSSKNGLNRIALIIFDEMGLSENAINNPLKVLHSLLEDISTGLAFIGISNWELDAAKMNRGIFLARADLTKDDLKITASVVFKSFIEEKRLNFDNFNREAEIINLLAESYFQYKNKLNEIKEYEDFHGSRDFYSLIKQVSEDFTKKKTDNENQILEIVQTALERNFQGLNSKTINIKNDFLSNYNQNVTSFGESNSILELIGMNLQDKNARYLMLIVKSDSATFIIDKFLNQEFRNRRILVGSKFDCDINAGKNSLNGDEYSFRTLSEIILYMERGWTIIMNEMDYIYGSLYDLFNQNFTIRKSGKKDCRIALGSVINPMCYVHDHFKCIIMVHEVQLCECDTPFLNRFEKYFLNFDTIITDQQQTYIKILTSWLERVFNYEGKLKAINMDIIMPNYTQETIVSLILNEMQDKQETESIIEKSKIELIKLCSNFSLLSVAQLRLLNENEKEKRQFIERYNEIFNKNKDLYTYIDNFQYSEFKSVVYTFDSVTKKLNDILIKIPHVETNVGFFNTEKELSFELSKFYENPLKQLLIVRLDWQSHAKHLSLLKFLIDKIERDFRRKNDCVNKKSFCIIIHLKPNLDEMKYKDLNKYKLNFLSGYDQIMMDNLDSKLFDFEISELVFLPFNKIISEEHVVKLDELYYELLVNAINKFKYTDISVFQNRDNDEQKIYDYKINLIKYLNSNKVFPQRLLDILKKKIYEEFDAADSNEFKDWHSEILKGSSILKITFNLNVILKQLIMSKILKPFMELFYQFERFLPFDSLINSFINGDDKMPISILDSFIKYENELNFQIKAKNFNQSNEIVVLFGLQLPFMRKEYEILENIRDLNPLISKIDSIESNSIQNPNILQQFKREFCYLVSSKSIIQACLNEKNKKEIFEKYLHDMVYLKYSNFFENDKKLSLFLISLIKKLIENNNDIDDQFDLSNIYYYMIKFHVRFQKLLDILKIFKSIFNDELTQQQILKNVLQNQLNENFQNIHKELVENLLKEIFHQLLDHVHQIELQHFCNLYIESVNIRINYKHVIRIYNSCCFMNELVKFSFKLFGEEHKEAKTMVTRIVAIIKENDVNKFLNSSKSIEAILSLIQTTLVPFKLKEELSKFENFIFGLMLEENFKDKHVFKIFFDQFCKNEFSLKYAGPIFEKLLKSIRIDIGLKFLANESEENFFVDILDQKFNEIGIQSPLAIIFVETIGNKVGIDAKKLESKFFEKYLNKNRDAINYLYKVLESSVSGLIGSEDIKNIKNKNIAALTSIAVFKRLITVYCKELENDHENDMDTVNIKFFNQILSHNQYKIKNSLCILALRIFYRKIGSYSKLKDYVTTNIRFEWRKNLNFENSESLLDICLIEEVLEQNIVNSSELIQQILFLKETDDIEKYQKSIETSSTYEFMVILLSLFNGIYLKNTQNSESCKWFKNYFKHHFQNLISKTNNSYFNSLLNNLIDNFPSIEFLRAKPTMEINNLKVASVIIHVASITASLNHLNNPFIRIFKKNDGQKNMFWLSTQDDKEFVLLKLYGNMTFKSYTDEEIEDKKRHIREGPGLGLYSKKIYIFFYMLT